MRVITGKYKGRHFDVPRTFKARPTTDFAKESLFNVLMGYIDFEEAHALDLFAGTGSITLELLSRGCSRVVSVEKDSLHYRFITSFLEKLGDEAAVPIKGMSLNSLQAFTNSSTSSLPTLLTLCQILSTCPTWYWNETYYCLKVYSSWNTGKRTISRTIHALSTIVRMVV